MDNELDLEARNLLNLFRLAAKLEDTTPEQAEILNEGIRHIEELGTLEGLDERCIELGFEIMGPDSEVGID